MAKITSKTKATTKTVCPVCVNGRGEYLDIKKHNLKHHNGRTPRARA